MKLGVFMIVIGSEQMGLYARMCVIVGVCSVYRGGEQANSNYKGPEAKICLAGGNTLHFYAWNQAEMGESNSDGSRGVEGIRAPPRHCLSIDEL